MARQISGNGVVLPAKQVDVSLKGKFKVEVLSIMGENDGIPGAASESKLALCEYPDGYQKTHQVRSLDALCVYITQMLRNKYGVRQNIKFLEVPTSLEVGTFLIEV